MTNQQNARPTVHEPMGTRVWIAALVVGTWAVAIGVMSAPRPYSLWPSVGHVASVLVGAVVGVFALAVFHALLLGPEATDTTNGVKP